MLIDALIGQLKEEFQKIALMDYRYVLQNNAFTQEINSTRASYMRPN